MGGAQPLAVTMHDGVAICVDCDPARLQRRIDHRYLDAEARDVSHALELALRARDARAAVDRPAGQRGRYLPAASGEGRPRRRRHRPDLGPRSAVLPSARHRTRRLAGQRAAGPGRVHREVPRQHGAPGGSHGGIPRPGRRGLRLRQLHPRRGPQGRLRPGVRAPGFVPAHIRPLFEEGLGPFRWAALSGDPGDIAATDEALLELFPDNQHLHRWIRIAGECAEFEGLPVRICWLGYGERHLAGLRFNEMVASGQVSAPVAIGRDHLDSGSVASPYRWTETMADGSDASRRLAAAQRLAQYGIRRVLGVAAPRRRGRYGPLVARRPGLHRRWDRARRRQAHPRADQRPGDGRPGPHRRRLRPRSRRGP